MLVNGIEMIILTLLLFDDFLIWQSRPIKESCLNAFLAVYINLSFLLKKSSDNKNREWFIYLV